MNIRIENILGIEAASLDVSAGEIVEIVGPNAAGKTSIATCLQALFAREANPLGYPVASMREYSHEGAAQCGAWLTGSAETWAVEWIPTRSDGAITHGADDGTCESHAYAVGLTDFTARQSGKQRAALLQPVLLPDPATVLDRLRDELKPYLPAQDIAGCVAEVELRGWEAGESVYRGRAQEAKRQWCSFTGRRQYGSKIAADWRPDGWTAEHDGLTVLDAEKRLLEAREDRDALLRENAVSEAVLLAAEAARGRLPELEQALREPTNALVGAKEALNSARAAVTAADKRVREATSRLGQTVAYLRELNRRLADGNPDARCPHCGAGLSIASDMAGATVTAHIPGDSTALEAQIAETDAKRAAALKARDAAIAQRDEVANHVSTVEAEHRVTVSRRDDAQSALDAARQAASVTGVPDDELRRRARAAADELVDVRALVVGAVKSRKAAAAQSESVEHYQAILRALGPSGVRAGILDKRLRQLNAGLARLSSEAGLPQITVSAGGRITLGSRAPFSGAERWWAQAALQMTIAAMTGSAAVVLDRADLLDAEGRQGLIRAARVATSSRGRIAVVLCSTGEPEDEPPWRQVVLAGGRTFDPQTEEK